MWYRARQAENYFFGVPYPKVESAFCIASGMITKVEDKGCKRAKWVLKAAQVQQDTFDHALMSAAIQVLPNTMKKDHKKMNEFAKMIFNQTKLELGSKKMIVQV